MLCCVWSCGWLAFFLFLLFSFLFWAVPSSVLTSEALLPCHSSRHPPPPATPKAYSASRPHPQRSTGGDVRSLVVLVGCHPKETLHYCRVTLVVFSSACSDWTYAGHHLLYLLLMAMLVLLRSQTEWVSPPESRPPPRPSTNPRTWTLMLRALIRTAPGKGGGRNTETEATMRAWHVGLQKLRLYFLFMQWSMRMWMITDDAMEVHFGLRLLDRAADHASCHNYPRVNQAWELWHLQCWSNN